MLGKYKIALLLAVVALVGAALASAVPSRITNLGLSRDGSFTVLTIQGSAPAQFAHQSVEARNGKPFRIVVDCLASRHGLPQKDFAELPKSVIKEIRTSQYSVSPEEVVRVVLDLNEESVYRVEADGNDIKVYVSDQKTVPFPRWTGRTVKTSNYATVTPSVNKEKAPAVKEPVKPSVDKSPNTKVASSEIKPSAATNHKKPSVVVMNNKKENPSTSTAKGPYRLAAPDPNYTYGPVVTTAAEPKPLTTAAVVVGDITPKTPTAEPSSKASEKKPANVSKPSVVVAKTEPKAQKDLAGNTQKKAPVFADANADKAKVPEPGVSTNKSGPDNKDIHKPASPKAEAKSAENKMAESKPATAQKASDAGKDKNVVVASIDPADEKPAAPKPEVGENVNKIKTSRYRRESAKSAELKASQVVQFPQRMVIKYKRPIPRDPFASLITVDKQKQGNVDLTKVPNVETLNLVGILEPESGKGAALMEDLNGIGYILRPGDKVRNGYVAQIDQSAVYFQVNEYGWGRTIVKHMEK